MTHIKKILLFALAVLMLSACDMFRIDNYPGPDATLKGSILDEVTGELVETELNSGSRFQFQDLGEEFNPGLQARVINYTGEYQDKLFFSGEYMLNFNACNFYPFIVDKLVVKPGENVVDFKVKPYIRVKNVSITKVGNEIVATFKLQAGNPEVRLSNIRLFAATDVHVGEGVTAHNPDTPGADEPQFQRSFSPAIVIDEATTHELRFDLTKTRNNAFFKIKKNYYLRVGAMASVPNPSSVTGESVGTIRRNYASYVVINFNAP